MLDRILIPLDRSTLAEQAIPIATALARASSAALDLVLAHKPGTREEPFTPSWSDLHDPEDWRYLRQVATELGDAGVPATVDVRCAPPVTAIRQRQREIGADLIVMTSHGRTGLSRTWLGSVADGVIRTADVPVLIVRAGSERQRRDAGAALYRQILVPIDGSPLSATILEPALALAKACRARVTLLRVIEPSATYVYDVSVPTFPTRIPDPEATLDAESLAEAELAALAHRLSHEHGIIVDTMVTIGAPAVAILDAAHAIHADLVAMTTHGYGAARYVLGSVTDGVLRGGHLPMLVYRPSEVPAARAEELEVLQA